MFCQLLCGCWTETELWMYLTRTFYLCVTLTFTSSLVLTRDHLIVCSTSYVPFKFEFPLPLPPSFPPSALHYHPCPSSAPMELPNFPWIPNSVLQSKTPSLYFLPPPSLPFHYFSVWGSRQPMMSLGPCDLYNIPKEEGEGLLVTWSSPLPFMAWPFSFPGMLRWNWGRRRSPEDNSSNLLLLALLLLISFVLLHSSLYSFIVHMKQVFSKRNLSWYSWYKNCGEVSTILLGSFCSIWYLPKCYEGKF